MAPRRRELRILQAAKKEAILAVDLYNRPGADRSLQAFIVHMGIAWLYLAQAILTRDGVDFTYRDGTRPILVDGEPKTWELARAITHLYPNSNDPVRRNVEFFLRLRNKIEHRHSQMLEAVVAGRAQSYIVNFEEKVVAEFGRGESLGQALRLPVFLTSLSDDAVAAVKKAFLLLPAQIRTFIVDYDNELPADVRNHPAYEFRLLLIPKTTSKSHADAAIEFVKLADLTSEQREKLDESLVIIRDRQVGVSHKGNLRPKAVAAAVQARIPWKFSATPQHSGAVTHYGIKPQAGADKTATDTTYCLFDEAHDDFVYTPAWVEKLARELATDDGYRTVFGRDPIPKPA
jgi:Protein of unknown function (DUF3644)